MPDRENRRAKQECSEDPVPGRSDAGRDFSPSDLPDDAPEEHTENPRAAPAPGVPISNHELERLKEKARTEDDQPDVPAQEDRPPEEDDG